MQLIKAMASFKLHCRKWLSNHPYCRTIFFQVTLPTYCAIHLTNNGLEFWNLYCRLYPRPVLAFGCCLCLRLSVCLCVRPSVRPSVCAVSTCLSAITHHPFTLRSPNLDHMCKIPWLRSLLFWGWLTLTFKVKFNFKAKNYPILSLSAR